ncbi:SWI/SNF-related matrix-associated actin-dependent regulator of chromatin subfamily A-like protein 1 [Andrena cerasifolii]|uniref:SWI/SNF-related matrix-associated actin-dependent regulator of chromatin subfamily A-like protein 1 n=1 Tax=Andrena cerasifolii TaxID=2819439 RepID=UPI0040384EE4
MSYSKEEIERKRLLAVQRKREAQVQQRLSNSPKIGSNALNASANSSIPSNENKPYNTTKSFGYIGKNYNEHKSGNYSFKSNTKFNKQTERFNPIKTTNFFGQKPHVTGNCYMISDERFALETSSYFAPIIETLKTIPSKSYDMKTKTWNFHLKDYDNLMEKLINFKAGIQVAGLPIKVLQIFRKNDNSNNAVTNIDLSGIDPQLVKSLMPFQREGVCYGISKNGRCMIADDMGLGKTIQSLGIAHYFRNDWPLLIVVQSSVRYQWSEAIYKFLPSVPTHYVNHFTSGNDIIVDSKIVITSYDLLARAIDKFERRTFGFVILDESHTVKSEKTARYKATRRLVSQACHVILLSGTPALSRPMELYSQINLIMPNFMKYEDYGIRYCAGEKTPYGWNFQGSSNLQELELLLKRTCVIRRLKSDALFKLPSKNREVVILNPDLIKAGTEEMIEMSKTLERKALSSLERHNTLLQYYTESGLAKHKAVCDYVSKIFQRKQKCLIFAHHCNVLDAICATALSENINHIRIDGKTNPERRKYLVDQFQNSDDCVAAVLSITAASVGITLTAAHLVIFAELFWNPGVLCQAEDRVHRIGQNDNVVIQYLVAKNTADDYLWPLIQKKMNVLNEAGLDQDFSLKDIRVTKQALDARQKTLDSFTRSEKKTNDTIVQSNENEVQDVLPENSFSAITEEFEELLELSGDDFNCSEWDVNE